MTQLGLALAALYLTHYGISSTRLREGLVARLGEGPYRGLYSLITALIFVWLVFAYRNAPYVELWPAMPWLVVLTHFGMLLAVILLVGGLSTPNPTAIAGEAALERPEPATGVLRITRHPVMWAIGLWGIAHVLANGDLAAMLLFGGLAGLALIGTILLDRKYERRAGEAYLRFERATSAVPFVAILQGRQRLVLGEIGWARLGGALLLFAILYAVHPWLFGVAPRIG
jgi:uncharacterized membrane protein